MNWNQTSIMQSGKLNNIRVITLKLHQSTNVFSYQYDGVVKKKYIYFFIYKVSLKSDSKQDQNKKRRCCLHWRRTRKEELVLVIYFPLICTESFTVIVSYWVDEREIIQTLDTNRLWVMCCQKSQSGKKVVTKNRRARFKWWSCAVWQ